MKNNCTALTFVWESGIIRNVLLPTCEVMKNYVDKIVILHCGSKSQMGEYDAFSYISNVYVEWFDYKGEIDSVIHYISKFVPKNGWALFLDSDQRPTELMLSNLGNSIFDLESNNIRFGAYNTVHHEYSKNLYIKGYPPPSREEYNRQPVYALRCLVKMNEYFNVVSNHGMHYSFRSDRDDILYFPHGLNHYKLYFEYFSSIFLTGYSDPTMHTRSQIPEQVEKDQKNKDFYIQFEQLKRKYNMMLSNDFNDRSYTKTIPSEFFEFFSNPMFDKTKNPNTTHFLHNAFIFCTQYKFSLDESLSHKRYCGNACCKYGNIQL